MRKFKRPRSINLDAKHYSQLVDFDQLSLITEPPLTIGLSLDEITSMAKPEFHCHTQDVERLVHLISRVSKSSADEVKRLANAFIIQDGIKHRRSGKTKKDFEVALKSIIGE